jgi:hypothetical protein
MFKFNTEEITVGDTTHHLDVCTNMRYAKRHSPAFASKRQHQKDEEKQVV